MPNKDFFMGIYCPPALPAKDYPSRITQEVYSRLKEVGVKHIYGYYEEQQGEEYIERSLDLCAANGMYFYPRLEIFNHYTGMYGNAEYPHYSELTDKEKAKLDEEFIKWMNKLKDHPGCGGIFIGDECSYEAFDGMGAASELFAKQCPEKEFHYNALNYFGDDKTMFYRESGDLDKELRLVGELEYNAENRFNRYKVYLEKYLDKCTTNHLSTDIYPFALTWDKVPASIHRGLYETTTMFASYKRDRGITCYQCIQIGNWDLTPRFIGRPETALHMNISAAYQLDGYIFFPGMFPNDWLMSDTMNPGAHGITGLLDCTGKPTVHYAYVQRLNEHLQKCAPALLNADWLGVCTIGEFEGGFGDVDFDEIEWSECIYKGGLPENERYEYAGNIPEISTSSQLFIGVFENRSEYIYWITNNSIVTDVGFEVKVAGDWSLTIDGKTVHGNGIVKVSDLNAGESVLLTVNKLEA